MNIQEILATYEIFDSELEELRLFRANRLRDIEENNTPVPLRGKPRLALHLIPFFTKVKQEVFDLSGFASTYSKYLLPIGASLPNFHYNYDGLLYFSPSGRQEHYRTYAQVFTNGTIESVTTSIFIDNEQGNFQKEKFISSWYDTELKKCLTNLIIFQKEALSVCPPLVLMISLVNITDYQLLDQNNIYSSSPIPIREKHLILPEIFITDLEVDPKEILEPVFQDIARASGLIKL